MRASTERVLFRTPGFDSFWFSPWIVSLLHVAVFTCVLLTACAGLYSNDLFAFNIVRPEAGWRKLEGVGGPVPGPRGWFQAAAVGSGGMAVHGGNALDNSRLGDLFLLRQI